MRLLAIANSSSKKNSTFFAGSTMCVIVDTNVAHRVFGAKVDLDFLKISEVLLGPRPAFRLTLAYGGRLRRELEKNDEYRRLLLALDRSGRTISVQDERVDQREAELADACTSDDPHVIALAQLSGARLLCSHDQLLHCDFRDKRLVDRPRGKVYQNASHAPLLRSIANACPRCRPRAT